MWVHIPRSFRALLQASSWCEEGSFPWRHLLGGTAKSTYVIIILYECVHLPDDRFFQGQDLTHPIVTVSIIVAGSEWLLNMGLFTLGMHESLSLKKWYNNVPGMGSREGKGELPELGLCEKQSAQILTLHSKVCWELEVLPLRDATWQLS